MAMNNQLLAVVQHIENERGVSREIVLTAIEQAISQAARKNQSVTNDLRVSIDRKDLSLHVYDTLVLCYGVFIGKCKLFKNSIFRAFTMLLTLAICLATCFLKQHSVVDGIAAFVMLGLAILAYDLIAKCFSKK